jgi:group I intron endonuclease
MEYLVYKITNSINGHFYVGATTKPINVRFAQHCKNKNYQYPLYNDILTHGPDSFAIEIIEICLDKQTMTIKELYWIKYYIENSPLLLYNIRKPKDPFVPSEEYMAMTRELKSHLKRNQRWLADQIEMREVALSNKINGIEDWTQEDLDKINSVLHTTFKL